MTTRLCAFVWLLCACGPNDPTFEPAFEPAVTTEAALTTRTVQRTINKGQAVTSGYVDSMNFQFIEVLKNTVNGVPSAFMVFQQIGNDPTSQVCFPDPIVGTVCSYTRHTYDMASGDIPGRDLNVGQNSAHLNTNISTNPNMAFSHCVGDDIAGTMTCTNTAPVGLFDVNFAKTSTNYYKYNGVIETKTGPQVVKTTGNQQQYSASASGTMAGWPVGASADSTFGLSSTITLVITTQ